MLTVVLEEERDWQIVYAELVRKGKLFLWYKIMINSFYITNVYWDCSCFAFYTTYEIESCQTSTSSDIFT
jgi:hypothetical protein